MILNNKRLNECTKEELILCINQLSTHHDCIYCEDIQIDGAPGVYCEESFCYHTGYICSCKCPKFDIGTIE